MMNSIVWNTTVSFIWLVRLEMGKNINTEMQPPELTDQFLPFLASLYADNYLPVLLLALTPNYTKPFNPQSSHQHGQIHST
jgi:hypothetical protein